MLLRAGNQIVKDAAVHALARQKQQRRLIVAQVVVGDANSTCEGIGHNALESVAPAATVMAGTA